MDTLSIAILAIGFPFSLVGFLLIRKWAKLKEQSRPVRRASYRADLFNSITDKELRAASDAAVIAAGIVTGTVIHS